MIFFPKKWGLFLTPPPHLPENLKKWVSNLGGSGAKTHFGGAFIGQNNDFTKSLTSNSTPWGRVCESAQKSPRCGICGVFPYIGLPSFDLTTSANDFKKLSRATKQPIRHESTSLARGHMGGGRLGGTWSWDPGPRHGLGGPKTRKRVFRTQVQIHTQQPQHANNIQPPPIKKRYPGAGEYGGQDPKNHWGIIFGPKMMILQGVRRYKPYIGVCYANNPKKRGCMPLAPALDLTTSL